MQPLPDSTGSDSGSQTPGEGGGFSDPTGRKVDLRSLINQANSIPISTIVTSYGQRVDDYNRRIRCPFHSGGNERTPSLWIYPDTNTFHCFGCKAGGRPVDWIARHEVMNKVDAALHIIERWGAHINTTQETAEIKGAGYDKAIFDFSNCVRMFIRKHEASVEAITYVEKLCFSFDKMNHKYHLNHDGLVALIDKIKKRLEIY